MQVVYIHTFRQTYIIFKNLKNVRNNLNRRKSNFVLEEISKVHLSDEFENVK